MQDYKRPHDRLPKHKDDDNLGITFTVILVVVTGALAGSLAAIIMNDAGLTDAFINSFA